jgi:hypothetical protein
MTSSSEEEAGEAFRTGCQLSVTPAAFLVAVSMIERRAGRRRAPGPARAADHPRRAARPPRRVQPGRLRAAAPAPRRRGPAAGNLPRRLTPAAFPHWPSLVRGGQAGGRAVARAAARPAPRRRGNLPGRARRPRAGRLATSAPARPVRGLSAVGAEGVGRVPGCGGGGRSAELADRLAGFANLVGNRFA